MVWYLSYRNPAIKINILGKNNWSLLCKDSRNRIQDGPHPHPFWCTSFIYCYQGKGYEIQCKPSHNFNRQTLRCDKDYVCDI